MKRRDCSDSLQAPNDNTRFCARFADAPLDLWFADESALRRIHTGYIIGCAQKETASSARSQPRIEVSLLALSLELWRAGQYSCLNPHLLLRKRPAASRLQVTCAAAQHMQTYVAFSSAGFSPVHKGRD